MRVIFKGHYVARLVDGKVVAVRLYYQCQYSEWVGVFSLIEFRE